MGPSAGQGPAFYDWLLLGPAVTQVTALWLHGRKLYSGRRAVLQKASFWEGWGMSQLKVGFVAKWLDS